MIFMQCDVDTQYQYSSPQSPYGFLNESGLSFSPKLTLLHPNISMHILHTVLKRIPKMSTWRICLTINSFFSR